MNSDFNRGRYATSDTQMGKYVTRAANALNDVLARAHAQGLDATITAGDAPGGWGSRAPQIIKITLNRPVKG